MSVPTLTTFIIYSLAMLGIGVFFYRRTASLSDYVLGGRRLGAPVAALSSGASDMSGWLMLGLPGALYSSGASSLWISVGLCAGALLNWIFVAPRLRRFTELANDSITIPDYLENRFEDETRLLRVISAVVILVFFAIYASSGLVSGAILFEKSFGVDYTIAAWGSAFVIVAYTFLGGFHAVSWTDFFQGLLMLLALLIVPVVVTIELGGLDKVVSGIRGVDASRLEILGETTALGLVSLTAWGLGYFGQPHILARFMSIRSADDIPAARLIGMSWMVLALIGAMLTGFFGIAYFSQKPLANPETVFIALTQVLFNPWIAGVLLAAIFAAIMSTIDSQLLVCSSAISEDFYKAFFRREASQKELIWIGRGAVIVIALVALFLASDRESRVLDLVAYAWAGFGAGFGPVIILSLFWRRMTRNGAALGMIAGAVTVIVWKQLQGGIFDLYEIVPGSLICVLVIVLGSLLDKALPESSRLFDETKG